MCIDTYANTCMFLYAYICIKNQYTYMCNYIQSTYKYEYTHTPRQYKKCLQHLLWSTFSMYYQSTIVISVALTQ